MGETTRPRGCGPHTSRARVGSAGQGCAPEICPEEGGRREGRRGFRSGKGGRDLRQNTRRRIRYGDRGQTKTECLERRRCESARMGKRRPEGVVLSGCEDRMRSFSALRPIRPV